MVEPKLEFPEPLGCSGPQVFQRALDGADEFQVRGPPRVDFRPHRALQGKQGRKKPDRECDHNCANRREQAAVAAQEPAESVALRRPTGGDRSVLQIPHDVVAQRTGAQVTPLALLRQRRADDRVDVGGEAAHERARSFGFLFTDPAQRFSGCGAAHFDGRRAGDQFIEHHTERINIRARVDGSVAPEGLLRRHGGQCSEHYARAGVDRAVRVLVEKCGDAKIQHHRPAVVAHQHVRGFEVAVHDADLMCRVHSVGEARDEAQLLLEGPAAGGPVELRPLDVLQRHPRLRAVIGVFDAEVVELGDPRMVEPRERIRFACEACHRFFARGIRTHALERDPALWGILHRKVDYTHRTRSQTAQQREAPEPADGWRRVRRGNIGFAREQTRAAGVRGEQRAQLHGERGIRVLELRQSLGLLGLRERTQRMELGFQSMVVRAIARGSRVFGHGGVGRKPPRAGKSLKLRAHSGGHRRGPCARIALSIEKRPGPTKISAV